MKRCTACKQDKPLDSFGRDRSRGDGLNAKCKPCHNKQTAAWRNTETGKQYHRSHKKASRDADPARTRWRNAVAQKRRSGKIKPLDACESCGATEKLEGHHPSYADDMKFCMTWLCIPCHRQLHTEAANG